MKKCCFLILLIFLVGCSTQPGTYYTGTSNTLEEINNKPIQVYFCPRDDCSNQLTNLINSANSSVHCAFFELNIFELIQTFDKRSDEIDIKIVVDHDYSDEVGGDFVRYDTRSAFMHNKFCIVDNKIVTTGSMNPTVNGDTRNNNNLLIIHSELLAKNYEDEFSELWSGVFGKGDNVLTPEIELNEIKIKNYFCPEDKCADKVVKELTKAQESIYFMTFSFTHDTIGDTIIDKFNTGVKVKGVFEARSKSKYSEHIKFNASGIDIKFDKNPGTMHHKVFIIDEKTTITGSFNPSNNADKNNDENIIIIEDKTIAKKFLQEFDYVWNFRK